ncbi:MAG: hypothetical protein MUE74_06275 [Bacteroidales bacterium]|nr:hypothetical protein [Bacteroidales bacterium]
MKAKIIPFTFFLSVCLLLQSCEEYTYKTYFGNAPVYLSYEELRSAVKVSEGAELQNPGKIVLKGDYIFIIDEMKGIHAIDNSNPSSPVKKAFVELPGVTDISVSGNALYADSYVDLVILDIQDISDIREAGRIENLLSYILPLTGNNHPQAYVDTHRGVVTAWELRQVREKDRYHDYYVPYVYFKTSDAFLSTMNPAGASTGISGNGVGIGGSTARFCIRENVMYALGEERLRVLDISDKLAPQEKPSSEYVWGVETMFLSGKYLFTGTFSGLQVYDITDPLVPHSIGWFGNATACDPVIVDDTLAYVTRRQGTACGGSTNLLDVVSINNISSPQLVISYTMTNPRGLCMDGDMLFVCDGSEGLKVYDASDPLIINTRLLKTYTAIHALSGVPVNGILFLLSEDGLLQYDFSDIQNITLLSSIVAD